MTYVICKNTECTHVKKLDEILEGSTLEEFIMSLQGSEGYKCTECGTVAVGSDGKAILSETPQYPSLYGILEYYKKQQELQEAYVKWSQEDEKGIAAMYV